METDETPEHEGIADPIDPEPPVPLDADTDTSEPTAVPAVPESGTRSWIRPTLFAIGSLLVIGLIASQIYLVTSLDQTRRDLSTLETEIADVQAAVGDVSDDVSGLTEDLTAVKDGGRHTEDTSPAPTVADGFLPRFAPGGQDAALGLELPEITAVEAYSTETLAIDPADGTKRIWLIWAHWCPYCQEELPLMSEWYPPNADRFPNSELVTITTAMDPSRGNPLDEYLASEQFPFPVLRDDDGKLSAQFGVSAFPFWVVTNGDGTVLFRTAGLLGSDRVDQLFTQLAAFDG